MLVHLNLEVSGELYGWEAHYLRAGAVLDVVLATLELSRFQRTASKSIAGPRCCSERLCYTRRMGPADHARS